MTREQDERGTGRPSDDPQHDDGGAAILRGTGMDRRLFLRRSAVAGISLTAASGILAACSSPEEAAGDTPSEAGTATAAATAAAAAGAGAAARSGITIEYPQTGGDAIEFFTAIKNGATQAGEDLGVEVNIRATSAFDTLEQARLFEAAVAAEPTAIITGLWDPDPMEAPMRAATEAGIIVVILNAAPQTEPMFGALGFVGQDDKFAGSQGAISLSDAGATHIAIINHDLTQSNIRNRQDGITEGFDGQTTVVPVPFGDITGTRNRVVAALQNDPSIDAVFALSAEPGTEPSLAAIEEIGRTGDVLVAGFDFSPVVLQAIQDGQVLFAVDQQQYLQGYLPVVRAVQFASYGLTPARGDLTGPAFVTADTVEQVLELSEAGIR